MPGDLKTLGEALQKSNLSSEAKDKAIAKLIERSFYRKPGDAARLVGAVGDVELRESLTKTIRRYAKSKGEAMSTRIDEILLGQP